MVITTAIERQRVSQGELRLPHVRREVLQHQPVRRVALRPQPVRRAALRPPPVNRVAPRPQPVSPHPHQPVRRVALRPQPVRRVQTILPSKDHLLQGPLAPEAAEVIVEAGDIVVAELPEVAGALVEAEAEDDNLPQKTKNQFYKQKRLSEKIIRTAFYQHVFFDVLFNRHIRGTHVSQAIILAVSFFEQTHVISGINNGIRRVNHFIIANFNHLNPIIGYKNLFGGK